MFIPDFSIINMGWKSQGMKLGLKFLDPRNCLEVPEQFDPKFQFRHFQTQCFQPQNFQPMTFTPLIWKSKVQGWSCRLKSLGLKRLLDIWILVFSTKYDSTRNFSTINLQGVVSKHVYFSFLFNSWLLVYYSDFKQKSSKNELKLK